MNKINYYLKSLEEIKRIKENNLKSRVLLHACCGPCATYPLLFLFENGFDVTIFFNNSNIYPKLEYDRRLEELTRFVEMFNSEYGAKIEIVSTVYNNEEYNLDLEQYKDEDEGKTRCHICFKKRLENAYKYANEHGFNYFTTVMTISRQKDAQLLNAIGIELEGKYDNTKYFVSDFKKNCGIDIAKDMREKYDLYQQTYCGCKFTVEKRR